ncbi:HIT-like domain-containing protein, partial [Zopfochytrium polystomum]
LVHADDQFVVFHDINPSARVHLLIIPREHIPSVLNLTARHLPLLRSMRALGHQLLSELVDQGDTGYPVRLLGFHVPPFTSVQHLHLHVIAPPFKNWIRAAKYP